MYRQMLRAKIQRARVTGADLFYEGSITIDQDLMDAAGILPFEKVHILNIANGSRAETYVIKGERGKGEIIMNGAIARLAQVSDPVIILSYASCDEKEAKELIPKIVLVDDNNRIRDIIS
ncbi:aspartate 1-decarboxylase [bacterium]|nr:aspartate 1-decarboxylase [bacterium]